MSAVRPRSQARRRGIELLDRVDYRLARTRAREGGDLSSALSRLSQRRRDRARTPTSMTTDRFDDMPNTWIFGVYLDGGSPVRSASASRRRTCPDIAVGRCVSAICSSRSSSAARSSSIRPASSPIPITPEAFPELPYMTVRLGYVACGYFNADIGLATVRAEHQAFYRRVFLQAAAVASRGTYPGLIKPVCLMAADYPGGARTGVRALSVFPVELSSSGACCSSAATSLLAPPAARAYPIAVAAPDRQ